MTLGPDTLELRFEDSDYGLSARRLWEHTQLGQVNVFSQIISARHELNDTAAFIDVVLYRNNHFVLSRITLAQLRTGEVPSSSVSCGLTVAPELAYAPTTMTFMRMVDAHIELCSRRLGARDQHHQFLPSAHADSVFGVPFIYSSLQRRLQSMGKSKAGAEQWRATIENFQKKALRAEELDRSKLIPELMALDDEGEHISAVELVNLCDFKDLRLSVIPVINDAQRQLRFAAPPDRKLTRTKNLPKAQAGLPRTISSFDPVLGYRIEQVEHQTLWGPEHNWQAVTYSGKVISNTSKESAFQTVEAATELAASHAKLHFPKRLALGRWGHRAWSGGQEYREWLITLPYHPVSFFSSHFSVRNVLAHVRCDVREGSDGERVLLLQEVQSDWAQSARRAISTGRIEPGDDRCPPFMKEWPALAMKLVLLHAAHQGLDAVAWTRGAHQAFRYKGLGATGLNELYDRTLPREVNRMMKPFGGVCEMLGVYVPANFSIRQTENGYEVYSPENELLGTASTLEDARQFMPDGAHELLYEVHGVRLPDPVRNTIRGSGFPAWG